MRRAALQLFRSARRPITRKTFRIRTNQFTPSSYALGLRYLSSRRERSAAILLQSSMHLRSFTFAAVGGAIASGAYYLYAKPQAVPGGASNTQTRSLSVSDVRSTVTGTASGTAADDVTAERRAVVVGARELYTGTITGDGPLSKETDDYGRKVLEMMTPEQASQKLRKNEESWLVGRGSGVVRYDVVQIPSNDPIEDDHAEKIIEVPHTVTPSAEGTPNSDWMFWGVFDGHSGWVTSAKLRSVLISYVARELNTTYKSALADPALKFPKPEAIDSAIKQGFLRLDHEIVHESVNKVQKAQSKRVAAELLAPALSGSCALLSFYDSRSKTLRVACTGDSRAVLGRRGNTGKWTATALSVDQTGSNKDEEARMRAEHPGEPDVIRNGRVLGGLEPSRAFGDAIYKWSQSTQEQLKKTYFGRTASNLLKSPPYVTAEPVITTTKISPEKGDFLVMATDGLWEMLTNEEVVGLVGQWLDSQADTAGQRGAKPASSSWLTSWFSSQKAAGLPIEKNGVDTDSSGQRAPIRQRQWGVKSELNERFIVEDKNAATHLVRNALGGKDQDQLCALLTLPSPYSRRYRDDLTVEVIFFGEGENTGSVTLNVEASAQPSEAKAKL
jgi:pyruvate dehydrogenase phosphatase